MSLKTIGTVAIPNSTGSSFDHGAFDPKSRRIFVAHTGRDGVEVIDHDSRRHIATLPGFKEAAGVVADDGIVLVTNRGAASLAFVDAIIRIFEIKDPALDRLATIVRGADTSRPDLTPQCEGLLAISQGLSANHRDDHEMLKHGMVIYDALYTWCRLQGERS